MIIICCLLRCYLVMKGLQFLLPGYGTPPFSTRLTVCVSMWWADSSSAAESCSLTAKEEDEKNTRKAKSTAQSPGTKRISTVLAGAHTSSGLETVLSEEESQRRLRHKPLATHAGVCGCKCSCPPDGGSDAPTLTSTRSALRFQHHHCGLTTARGQERLYSFSLRKTLDHMLRYSYFPGHGKLKEEVKQRFIKVNFIIWIVWAEGLTDWMTKVIPITLQFFLFRQREVG